MIVNKDFYFGTSATEFYKITYISGLARHKLISNNLDFDMG